MTIFLLIVSIFGGAYQFQTRADHCKETSYKTEYCELPKKLSRY